MQTFYMVVEKERLYLFERSKNGFDRVYIEGNPDFLYSINAIRDYMKRLSAFIYEEYNLEHEEEMAFTLIDNENKIISDAIVNTLSGHIIEKINVECLIKYIILELQRDEKLYISEYGVNYDGRNYILKGNEIIKSDFSLLGYTLDCEEIIRSIR